MKTYFAYGTLLDIDLMRRFAPSARSLGIVRLDGCELVFARCADGRSSGCTLNERTGACAYGVLYRLCDRDMAALDEGAIEGRKRWVRKSVQVVDAAGEERETATYVIPGCPPAIAPSDEYVKPILRGLKALDLPSDYVADTVRRIARAQSDPASQSISVRGA